MKRVLPTAWKWSTIHLPGDKHDCSLFLNKLLNEPSSPDYPELFFTVFIKPPFGSEPSFLTVTQRVEVFLQYCQFSSALTSRQAVFGRCSAKSFDPYVW